jgi:NADH-quinone oxidoreductase subunit E
MLTEAERRAIEEAARHYERPRAACIEALKVVQLHRGWISDETLADVAALLGMSAAEAEGVATFYNHLYRKPVGRHVVLVCDSVSCWILGAEPLAAHLRATLDVPLGGTTADGEFTLIPVPCLGACDRAPAMIVDGVLYGNLTEEKLDRVLEEVRAGHKA